MSVNVVIIGGGLSGTRVAKQLQKNVKNIQITIVETQIEYLYNLATPRALVDPSFAKKLYLPYTSLLTGDNKVLNGKVESIEGNAVTLEDGSRLEFDYLVIASGTSYAGAYKPTQVKTTKDGLEYLQKYTDQIISAQSILLIGGGPSNIETAAEIKEKYHHKEVTIVSKSLLSNMELPAGSIERLKRKLRDAGVKLVMDERVEGDAVDTFEKKKWTLSSGATLEADLTITGSGGLVPNTGFLNSSQIELDDHKFVVVRATLQTSKQDNIFALGDVANTGAAKMAVPLDAQSAVVAGNIAALINKTALKDYSVSSIKLIVLSLGHTTSFAHLGPLSNFISDYGGKYLKCNDLMAAKCYTDFGLTWSDL